MGKERRHQTINPKRETANSITINPTKIMGTMTKIIKSFDLTPLFFLIPFLTQESSFSLFNPKKRKKGNRTTTKNQSFLVTIFLKFKLIQW